MHISLAGFAKKSLRAEFALAVQSLLQYVKGQST
jgi:hypothetical protein